MKHFHRTIVLGLGSVALLAAMVASGAKRAPTVTSKIHQYHGTINVDFGGSPGEGWTAIAKAYEKIQPGVHIHIQWQDPNTYSTALTAQIAGGHPSWDLVTNNTVSALITEGKFVNYRPYLFQMDPYTHKLWKDSFKWNEMGYNPITGQGGTGTAGALYSLSDQEIQVIFTYNEGLWAKAGIRKTPTTFNQLLADFKKLKASGTIPFAVGGDYNSLWGDESGWMLQTYPAQYTEIAVKEAEARPGDYDYVKAINGKWVFKPSNPFNDVSTKVIDNPVREWALIRQAKLPSFNLTSAPQMALDRNLRALFSYTEPGWTGTSDTQAFSLFLAGKAATALNLTPIVTTFSKDLKSVTYTGKAGKRFKSFKLGLFNLPSMTGKYVEGPAQTIALNIGYQGFIYKSAAQSALDMNFMEWLTSPQGATVMENAAQRSPNGGPSQLTLTNFTLPGKLNQEFHKVPIMPEANSPAMLIERGLDNYQPSVVSWVDLAQKYFTGAMRTKAYAKASEANIKKYFVPALKAVGDMTLQDLKTPSKEPVPPAKQP